MSTHYYTLLKALFEVKTGEYPVKTHVFLTEIAYFHYKNVDFLPF